MYSTVGMDKMKQLAMLLIVHKRMLNLGFEGLQVTFEALTNLFTPTHN